MLEQDSLASITPDDASKCTAGEGARGGGGPMLPGLLVVAGGLSLCGATGAAPSEARVAEFAPLCSQ